MTSRPGNGALALHSMHRSKRLCNVVRVRTQAGQELRITDHDRTITFDGAKYVPIVFAGMSAERREIGLRTPDQDLHGIVDGTHITIPDLIGARFNEAEVWHAITDWQYPWLPVARHYKRVHSIEWDDGKWKAELDGITLILERPAGGRFGGVATYECPYVLGGPHCKKDIRSLTQWGTRVATVVDPYLDVVLSAFIGAWDDDYYRDGVIHWLWAAPTYESQVTALTTGTQVVRAGAGWTVDAFAGLTVRLLKWSGGPLELKNLPPLTPSYARITANTADTITFPTTPAMAGFAGGTWFDVVPDCDNVGAKSLVTKYLGATQQVELFEPTPFPIVSGDVGILYPGCDGLFATCRDKFSNSLNFGGWHLQPKPGDNLEPVQ